MTAENYHKEEALGKAYDSRLMKRLLTYLRPYKPQVAAGVLLLIIGSLVQVGMVFLIKSGIDTYIAQGDAAGLGLLAVTFAGAIFVANLMKSTEACALHTSVLFTITPCFSRLWKLSARCLLLCCFISAV